MNSGCSLEAEEGDLQGVLQKDWASGSEEKENFKDDFSIFEQLVYDGAI